MMEPMSQARVDASVPTLRLPVVPVTVVVVTRGLSDYLPRTLEALAGQTRPPEQVLLVDAAADATDGPGTLLTELTELTSRLWPDADVDVSVLAAPGARTMGGAARAALGAVALHGRMQDQGWLWLLHDDSAPEPTALAELLRAVELAPSVALAGCKQRTWSDPVRVLEAGVSTSRFGRRMTGLDEPEVDQGQHDAREDVLAVGTAGALVRRDVWDELGGPDPSLGPYGDGLDLGRRARLAGHRVVVVPSAVVRHAQASLNRGRADWDARRSTQARREAYLHTQLVSASVVAVPLVVLLAVASSVVRALGRVATKEPHLVLAELMAPWRVLSRPGRIARARARDAATRVVPRRTLRPLQATWRDVVGQLRDRRMVAVERRRSRTAPSELEFAELAALRRRRRAALTTVLIAAAAVDLVVLGTWISQVVGGARLAGGSLLFGDAGRRGLVAEATSWWVSGGFGAAAPPDPFLAALVPLTAVVGTAGRAVAVVLLGSLLLAAVGAWFAAGAATRSLLLRAWAVLVWTAAPALLVSVEQVRLGAVLAHAVVPWFALGLARGVGAAQTDLVESGLVGAARLTPRDGAAARAEATDEAEATGSDKAEATEPAADEEPAPRAGVRAATAEPSLAAAAGAALAFALLTAAAPVLLPAGLLVLLAVGLVVRRRGRLLWLPLPALALHGPVLVEAATHWRDGGWRLLLAEPGMPLAVDPAAPWQQLLGWPVQPRSWTALPWPEAVGAALPLVATGVILLLALPALLHRPPRGRAARIAWLTVAVGTAAALASTRVVSGVAETPEGARLAVSSAAPGISLALAGALAAALIALSGLRPALARHSFGWRQVLSGLLVLLAALGPGLTLGVWVARHDIALTATDIPVVPAIGRQMQESGGLRVLALEPAGDGVVATVLRADGRQLTDSSRVLQVRSTLGAPADPAQSEVAGLAARLAVGASSDVSADLDALGIGAVLVPPGEDAERAVLAGRLDATPGLERVTATASGIIWRSAGLAVGTAGWARVLDATGDTTGEVLDVLPAGAEPGLDIELAAGDGPRLLVLAERSDAGWHARLDGQRLRAVETTWRQAFELPAEGGHLVVEHAPAMRTPWLILQAVLLLVTVLLAVPVRRRRGGQR